MGTPKPPAYGDIGGELDAAAKPQRPNLRALPARPDQDDNAVAANAAKLGAAYGASTALTPAPSAVASLRIEVPDYLDLELRQRAAAEGVTKAYLVIKALADAGFRVDEADLVPDRRKLRTKRGG